jgi:hypothetical protein
MFRSCRLFPAIGYVVPLAAVMRQARAAEPLEIREGFWEITTTSRVASQLPAELLAKVPPERRAQMLASLKAAQPQATARTSRACLKRENIVSDTLIGGTQTAKRKSRRRFRNSNSTLNARRSIRLRSLSA